MNREDLAWAAGFMDGEGHFATRGSDHSDYPFVSVAQVEREPLERLQSILGVGLIRGPIQKKIGQPHWNWQVNGFERVQHVVAQLWPWLGSYRADQARSVVLRARVTPARRASFAEGSCPTPGKCRRGHDKKGRRSCRLCANENKRKRYWKARGVAIPPPNRRRQAA